MQTLWIHKLDHDILAKRDPIPVLDRNPVCLARQPRRPCLLGWISIHSPGRRRPIVPRSHARHLGILRQRRRRFGRALGMRFICADLRRCVARHIAPGRAVVRRGRNRDMNVLERDVSDSWAGKTGEQPAVLARGGDVHKTHVVNISNRVTIPSRCVGDLQPATVAPPSWCFVASLHHDVRPCYVVDITLRPLLQREPAIGVPDRNIVEDNVAHLRVGVAPEFDRMRVASNRHVLDVQPA